MLRLFSISSLFLVVSLLSTTSWADKIPVYIGTGGDQIYVAQFDSGTGALSDLSSAAKTSRPTFIWIHPETSSLYSVCELSRSRSNQGASICAWKIGSEGQLTLRSQHGAGGNGPCFVAVTDNGRWAAVANYGGGSVSLFPVAKDGEVGSASATIQHSGSSVNPRRQKEPHAHSSRFDPTGKRVVAADLGTDKVYLYDIGASGELNPAKPAAIDCPKGSGPRHLVFSPDGKYMLVLGELLGTITTIAYHTPAMEHVATVSTMADGVAEDAPRGSAEILFHPNGKWVYATNRGPNEIAVFDYDAQTGKVTRKFGINSGGVHPRNFRISPDGRFLLCANKNTDNIVVFKIDQTTGKLTATENNLAVDQPMCLKFYLPK